MPYKIELGDFENSLPSWVSKHLGETSITDKVNQHPHPPSPPEESSPREKLSKIEVSSFLATELNIMTQGDLDRLQETYSFPLGIRMRIPGNSETILSTGDGEVAFYEAVFSVGPGSESGWLYFKARLGKHILKGASNNVKGWKKRFFFISRDDWEFHPSIPRKEGVVQVPRSWGSPSKQCNKVSALSETKDERFCRVFEKIGEGGHFKIPVNLDLRTQIFHPQPSRMSSSGGGTVKGDIGGGAVIFAGDTSPAPSSSSSSSDSRLGSRSDSRLSLELRSDAMSKRIKLSQLAKAASLPEAMKTKTSSGTHVVPTPLPILGECSAAKSVPGEALGPHASVMASAVTAEKILAGMILPADKEKVEKLTFDQVVTKFLHVLGEHEMVRAQNWAIELEGALVEASAKEKKVAEKVKARNKEVARLESQVAELKKSQNLAKGKIIAAFKESEDF
ncbi:hypothetical protein Acr_07g0012730 [Actinidia rufa]|uniref:Uncharacterized protein n=1 Tax=Actinidia rufa TaxID=165716 RepID=A0A7J0EZL9_9ERIC|nr:hypothetical protein Acr_07g0012730 [Actinidia rufa]